MYSWDEDTSKWYGKGRYAYAPAASDARAEAAERAAASGPRTYQGKAGRMKKSLTPANISARLRPIRWLSRWM
jgi:hypothetical protein